MVLSFEFMERLAASSSRGGLRKVYTDIEDLKP